MCMNPHHRACDARLATAPLGPVGLARQTGADTRTDLKNPMRHASMRAWLMLLPAHVDTGGAQGHKDRSGKYGTGHLARHVRCATE